MVRLLSFLDAAPLARLRLVLTSTAMMRTRTVVPVPVMLLATSPAGPVERHRVILRTASAAASPFARAASKSPRMARARAFDTSLTL
jgi:hypothetical protein